MDHGEDLAAALCILLGTVVIVASIFGAVAVAKDSRTLLICVSNSFKVKSSLGYILNYPSSMLSYWSCS